MYTDHHDYIRRELWMRPTPHFGHVKKAKPGPKPARRGPYGCRRKTAKSRKYWERHGGYTGKAKR